MSEQPLIFNRMLVRTRRDRAARRPLDVDFLRVEAAERLAERLDDVTHTFPLAALIGNGRGHLHRALTGRAGIEHAVCLDMSEAQAKAAGSLSICADEEWLPLKEQHFDLIASSLSLHWVNDLPGTLIQINRALKPDGFFVANLIGGDTLTELRQSLLAAESAMGSGVAPRVSPFMDVRTAGSLLQRAGFALPVTDMDRITITYETPFKLLHELRQMGGANALMETHKGALRRDVLMAAMQHYQENFSNEDGRVRATVDLITMTGWAPHESQPKPLRPGSATMRLADALNTTEEKL
ncbi:MAG: methyltransferase domain-containing protein [Alphaproteobacteria bacterium]